MTLSSVCQTQECSWEKTGKGIDEVFITQCQSSSNRGTDKTMSAKQQSASRGAEKHWFWLIALFNGTMLVQKDHVVRTQFTLQWQRQQLVRGMPWTNSCHARKHGKMVDCIHCTGWHCPSAPKCRSDSFCPKLPMLCLVDCPFRWDKMIQRDKWMFFVMHWSWFGIGF